MSYIYVPDTLHAAGDQVRLALDHSLDHLEKNAFLRAWCSLVYLFPGLHPDEFLDAESRLPQTLRKFTSEAWRRFQAGELTENELYCYQAATTRIQRECTELKRSKPWLFEDHFGA